METITLAAVQENIIAFKIAQSYDENMPKEALYDVTRGYWKVNLNRADRAEYALSVYKGIVKEVYKIHQWLPAGSVPRPTLPDAEVPEGRYEFTGEVAEDRIRNRYLGKCISGLNGRNSVRYSY